VIARRKARSAALICAATSACQILPVMTRTSAFPIDPDTGCIFSQNVNYNFTEEWAQYSWTSSEMVHVSDGFDDWEETKDYDNDPLIGIYNGNPPIPYSTFNTYWSPNVDDESFADANCGYRRIRFNVDEKTYFASHTEELEDVAGHEFGHIVALDHTGDDESIVEFDNPNEPAIEPLMATCRAGLYSQDFSADDEAALFHVRTTLAPQAVTPNMGFERALGLLHWYSPNGGTLGTTTSNPKDGVRAAYFRATSSSQSFITEARVSNQKTHEFDIRAAIRGTDGGNAIFQLKLQGITYPSPLTCGSGYQIGNHNQNSPSVADAYQSCGSTMKHAPTNTWQAHEFETACNPNDSYLAVDLKVEVAISSADYGDGIYIYFDNVRARDLG
jgi:hypothetical protein